MVSYKLKLRKLVNSTLGISFNNRFFRSIFSIIDILDFLFRKLNGNLHLPKFSIRVRSVGMTGHFGGTGFVSSGKKILSIIKENTSITPNSSIFEIGCGCGRTAFQLCDYLKQGQYIGFDIDKVSIDSCLSNGFFNNCSFTFHHINIQNDVYNKKGLNIDESFKFPVESDSSDLVFLTSVFTHMYDVDIAYYIKEISRVLKSEGQCLMTTFLVDYGSEGKLFNFPYKENNNYFMDDLIKEKAVVFKKGFFIEEFDRYGMDMKCEPLLGSWRLNNDFINYDWPQDILIFSK